MGLNIRKSFKIGNLFRINKTKKGMSVSVGNKNLKLTVNDKKKVTFGLPGTGISYDTTLGDSKTSSGKKKTSSAKKPAASAKRPTSAKRPASAKKPAAKKTAAKK